MLKIALISVSNRNGLTEFARALIASGLTLIATEGTASFLHDQGIQAERVSDLIRTPEILGGRVKTLHPTIHGGILARTQDLDTLEALGISPIDLVVVNLYPFADALKRDDATPESLIEEIDIGGVALIRAAAKNHERVSVVVDPEDYPWIAKRLASGPDLDGADRQRLAAKAFRLTATYDALIADWMDPVLSRPETPWPDRLALALIRDQVLRYGENPHQRAALYRLSGQTARATLVTGQAKPLSYNNFLDMDAASSCVLTFERPACAIVKHAGPSGVAMADDIMTAYERAYQADPVSAFGSVIAFNRPLGKEAVDTVLNRHFVEILIAPNFTAEAVEWLEKWPRVRTLRLHPQGHTPSWQVRTLCDGYLVQERDHSVTEAAGFRSVGERPPTAEEEADLGFAWKVARFVPSNAIVLAREGQTCGIGGGQPNRVDSLALARDKARRAGWDQGPWVLASDGFLPFPDVVEQAAALGVTAIIQPGGAIRDSKVIASADQHGMALVMTGVRHFKH